MDFMSPAVNALTFITLAMVVLRLEGVCPEFKVELNSDGKVISNAGFSSAEGVKEELS